MFYCINQPCAPFLPSSWLKPNLVCYVRLREISVVVVDVNVYPFFVSSDLTCQLEEIEIGAFWLHCAT